MKKALAIVLAITLCLSMSATTYAAEIETPVTDPIVYEDMGWNQGTISGMWGSFQVYLPSGSSSMTGQATFRFYSSDTTDRVYIKLMKPNGTVVWDQSVPSVHHGIDPDGEEHYSPTFSGATAGYYTVEWTYYGTGGTLNCWVYNW